MLQNARYGGGPLILSCSSVDFCLCTEYKKKSKEVRNKIWLDKTPGCYWDKRNNTCHNYHPAKTVSCRLNPSNCHTFREN